MTSKLRNTISDFLKTITIEPVIFLFILGNFILVGSQIPTNILIYKICHIELNNTEEVCGNLGDESNKLVQDEVQILTNNFQMTGQWITSVPGILFSLYAGPLSDKFGRKPLMMFPILGFIFSSIGGIINYAFLESLPLQFFYIDTIPTFLGGMVVYYLGLYGYGASVSEPEERAHRIARLDGVETIATMVGTLLSPLVSKHVGYFGNYGLFAGLALSAAVYLQYFVKEPVDKKQTGDLEETETPSFLYSFFVTPLIDMKILLVKKRSCLLALLIALQLIIYCSYIFTYNSNVSILYLYMLVRFEDFSADDFAYFSVTLNVCSVFLLIVVMPIASGKFNLSDALLLTLISVAESLSLLLSPFTSDIKVFYAFQIVSTIGNCKFSIGRSLLSKFCEPDEVGKMFSILSILLSLTFMISNPIVRQLYNKTIDSFPGSFLLLMAAMLTVAGFGNLFTYLKQNKVELPSQNSDDNLISKEHKKDIADYIEL